jgi:hypothetical protein
MKHSGNSALDAMRGSLLQLHQKQSQKLDLDANQR